jgi:diaminohydroxyphosphoribosylaminopyrimidine deaminase/5-amino-6-(5-phosphoribosylamino)uracil reductase
VRILIDFGLKVSRDSKIFSSEAETLVFNLCKDSEEENVKFIKIEKENFLENLMQKLYENQIQSVLVEGGRFTLEQFIRPGLWDEAIIIKNENLKLKNGTKAPDFNSDITEQKKFRDNTIEFYKNTQTWNSPTAL